MEFTDLFAPHCSPFESLMSFLPAADAENLGKTCRSMREGVTSLFTPRMVDELTERLRNLPPERFFSLQGAPEKCRKNRAFVIRAVMRGSANYADAGEFQRDPLVCKIALISAKLLNPGEDERIFGTMDPELSSRADMRKVLETVVPTVSRDRWLKEGLGSVIYLFNTDLELKQEAIRQNGGDTGRELTSEEEKALGLNEVLSAIRRHRVPIVPKLRHSSF